MRYKTKKLLKTTALVTVGTAIVGLGGIKLVEIVKEHKLNGKIAGELGEGYMETDPVLQVAREL